MLDRQMLRDWVHRYNAEGLAGLADRPHRGPTPRLTPEQQAELMRIVEDGPDPETDGVVRWRRLDLQAVIARRFGVQLHERSVGKLLRRLGFARLSVRPKHPASEPEAQEAFKKLRPAGAGGAARTRGRQADRDLVPGRLDAARPRGGPAGHADPGLGTPRHRPRAPRDQRCAWAYLFGAVCPERAIGAGLVLPYVTRTPCTCICRRSAGTPP